MKSSEQIRLEEAREQKAPWKKWGPLSERTSVGHGARRLQRKWRCLELLHA